MRALPRLWLCADLGMLEAHALVESVGRALVGGPALVWLRSPAGHPAREVAEVAGRLRELTSGPLLVGDRLDVAIAVGADGVHLTERSLRPGDARRLAPPGFVVSCAVHDEAGVRGAADADALVISPFGDVPGKGHALGAEGFARLRGLAPGAFAVALGGVRGRDEARDAMAAGADAVAVRGLLGSTDIAARCDELRRAWSMP